MKLLYIINSLGTGGAEKLITDMLPLIKKKGIVIELLILNKVASIFINKIEENNIKIHYSPHKLYSLKNIFFLRKFVRQYNIVHVHLFPAQYWLALTFSKTPIIVTEHCTTNRRRKPVFKLLERFTYSQFDRIITISDKSDSAIKKWLGFPNVKFTIIENGINLETFYNAPKIVIKEVPLGTQKIIMVGRFNPTKDQPTAIKAMPFLPEKVHLLLVGEGNLKIDCENLAKELNVHKRVHFLGLRNDVPALLKSCDINLISSHSEGLSISSLEALASGKPLVTSDVNGLREINEGVGFSFEDANFQELAAKVNLLLNDKEKYDDVVRKSLNKVMEYDISLTVDKHLKVYDEILKAQQ